MRRDLGEYIGTEVLARESAQKENMQGTIGQNCKGVR